MSLDSTRTELFHLAGTVPLPESYPDVGLITLEDDCLPRESCEDRGCLSLVKIENRVSPTIVICTLVELADVTALRVCTASSSLRASSSRRRRDKKRHTDCGSHKCRSGECDFEYIYGKGSIVEAIGDGCAGIAFVRRGAQALRQEVTGIEIGGDYDLGLRSGIALTAAPKEKRPDRYQRATECYECECE